MNKGNSYLMTIVGILIFLLTMILFEDNILGLIFFATPAFIIMVYQAQKVSQDNNAPRAIYSHDMGYEYGIRKDNGMPTIVIHNNYPPQESPFLQSVRKHTQPYTIFGLTPDQASQYSDNICDTIRLKDLDPNQLPLELQDYIRAYVRQQFDKVYGVRQN